jgi:GDP-L-fucose synthase
LTASLHDHKHTFFFANRQDADLTNFNSTYALFQKLKPTFVIHLAAKVGGLYANMKDKVGFWTQNLSINNNVIKLSH